VSAAPDRDRHGTEANGTTRVDRLAAPGSFASGAHSPLRILFLARQLRVGGAERQLCLLARGLAEHGHRVGIALFYRRGELEHDLEGTKVELIGLGKGGRYELLSTIRRLDRLIAAFRPDILHGYLPIPNLLTLWQLGRRNRPRIVWGVRASALELAHYDRVTRWSYGLEARLARFADLVIANSRAGLSRAVEAGFPAARTIYIPNGIDRARFRPDPALREKARRRWGFDSDRFVIGAIGRSDPMKDFDTFLQAVARAATQRPELRAVALAVATEAQRADLQQRAAELGIADRLVLAGSGTDVAEALNGLNLYCSSSAYGEGFPNTVAEAMACAVPCLVTDVGDSAELVGEAGKVVPPRNPEAMADVIAGLAGLAEPERKGIGERLRKRTKEFAPDRLVNRTEEAFRELLTASQASRA
jgi:glycosyltransferase involved in cell wall biosynthesis